MSVNSTNLYQVKRLSEGRGDGSSTLHIFFALVYHKSISSMSFLFLLRLRLVVSLALGAICDDAYLAIVISA